MNREIMCFNMKYFPFTLLRASGANNIVRNHNNNNVLIALFIVVFWEGLDVQCHSNCTKSAILSSIIIRRLHLHSNEMLKMSVIDDLSRWDYRVSLTFVWQLFCALSVGLIIYDKILSQSCRDEDDMWNLTTTLSLCDILPKTCA